MNIFATDQDPSIAAKNLCDKHVVKMNLESPQMMSTAHRFFGDDDEILYKATHVNHPSTKWIMSNPDHYMWLFEHWQSMNKEYTHRYGKIHLSWTKLGEKLSVPPKSLVKVEEFCLPTPAMPDEFKVDGDVVESYRRYYQSKQDKFKMVWTKSNIPDWFKVKEIM